jgi:hypothetical protein
MRVQPVRRPLLPIAVTWVLLLGALGWPRDAHALLLTDDLFGYWKLDEESGTRFDSASSNDLTDNNAVGSAAGILNGAAQFTAANNEYLSIADNPTLSTGDIDFTFTGWFNADSLQDATAILGKYGTIQEYIVRNETLAGNNNLRFRVLDDTGTQSVNVISNVNLSPNQWYFFAAWHDAVGDTANIQVNNGAIDTLPYSFGVIDGPTDFDLGRDASNAVYWNGRIDEVGFWKRLLTPKERRTLYKNPKKLFRDHPSHQVASQVVNPEPPPVLLFATGLLGLAGWRRKRGTG